MKKEEVHKMAPTLSKIGHKDRGFNVPSTYFNTVEDGVFAEINTSKLNTDKPIYKTPDTYFETVKNSVVTKPKAQTFYNEITHSIPEGYFETLEDQVFNKIEKTSKVRTLTKLSKYVAPIAIAASLLIIFILNSTSNNITFETLATSEIEEFIENGNIYYDAESLASIFPEVTIEDTNYISTLSDSAVLNYLNEKDLETLIIEN